MMNKPFFVLLLLMIGVGATAQPNKKVGPALSKFLNTEFMIKYRDLRIEAESAAIGVQSRKDEIKPADLIRLRTAYDQTATRANQLIEGVKQDFLNAKKLKSIAEFPDMYSDGLRFKLQDLSSFYTSNFQQTLADAAVKDDKDGSAVLLLVIELIGLTKGLTNYFAEIKREARQYTEAHLQEHLVQPYRWRYWDELAGSVSPYEKFEKSDVLVADPAKEDPLDQQLQKMNAAINSLPVKGQSGSDGTSDFNVPADSSGTSNTDFQYEDWSPTETPSAPADTVGQRNVDPNIGKKSLPPTKASMKNNPTAPKPN